MEEEQNWFKKKKKKKTKKNQEACERTKPYFVREEEVVAVGLGARDK